MEELLKSDLRFENQGIGGDPKISVGSPPSVIDDIKVVFLGEWVGEGVFTFGYRVRDQSFNYSIRMRESMIGKVKKQKPFRINLNPLGTSISTSRRKIFSISECWISTKCHEE